MSNISSRQQSRILRVNGRSHQLGVSKETVQLDGRSVRVRDELGISLDPKQHAKPTCRDCRGNGVIERTVVVSANQLAERIGVAVTQIRSENNREHDMTVCGCVRPRYEKVRRAVLALPDG
jgi:hypothetical protein